ncbi:MAG: hypothetical protein V4485_02790 [Pseudomonadota bacterium]
MSTKKTCEWEELQLILDKAFNELESSGDADAASEAFEAIENYFVSNPSYKEEEVIYCQNKLSGIIDLLDLRKREIEDTIKEAVDKASKHERYLRSMALQVS